MHISEESKAHFETAKALIKSIQFSLERNRREGYPLYPAPEDSAESIKRRCVQARQELLMMEKGVQS